MEKRELKEGRRAVRGREGGGGGGKGEVRARYRQKDLHGGSTASQIT